jgi:hypothetical protein
MHAQRFIPVLLGLGAAHLVPFDYTLPVLFNPITQVQAGQELYYQYAETPNPFFDTFTHLRRLTSSRNVTCQATMSFSNDTFLPLSMLVRPEFCAGDRIAVFKIPYSVPNGNAGLEW